MIYVPRYFSYLCEINFYVINLFNSSHRFTSDWRLTNIMYADEEHFLDKCILEKNILLIIKHLKIKTNTFNVSSLF